MKAGAIALKRLIGRKEVLQGLSIILLILYIYSLKTGTIRVLRGLYTGSFRVPYGFLWSGFRVHGARKSYPRV